jgi:hypothetical protein
VFPTPERYQAIEKRSAQEHREHDRISAGVLSRFSKAKQEDRSEDGR